MNAEEWRPVPHTEGQYEVSSLGRVRKNYKSCTRIMAGCRLRSGYVTSHVDGRHVFRHVLVARAFHGEPEPGQMVRHLNGIPGDDRPENLAWGTAKENADDSKRHGTNYALNKTACKWGHEFTEANVFVDNLGRRICRTCQSRHRQREIERVADARRVRRHERNLTRIDRQVRATLTDGSWLVRYGIKPRYFREWPLTARRNRVALTSPEFHALLETTATEVAA